jgi:hypothetical protein
VTRSENQYRNLAAIAIDARKGREVWRQSADRWNRLVCIQKKPMNRWWAQ